MTPIIAIHMNAALIALVIGPAAFWARLGKTQRPIIHRAFGYAWVTSMLIAAISSIFIRDFSLPNIMGYTVIHILVPVVLISLFISFRHLYNHDIAKHKKVMIYLYWGGCIGAGIFTLLPNRYLGKLIWNLW